MEGKGEEGEYVVLDPRAAARGSHSGPSGGAYQSALVFMIGGGTYLEHISLMVRCDDCALPLESD
eukprot:scaffold3121_cov365-Prasinococcus_capsulatus_cf.AAC.5